MKPERSWTRQEYEFAYRQMRRGYMAQELYQWEEVTPMTTKAADYSIQAKDRNLAGWLNTDRFTKFFDAMQSNRHSIWSIPF